MRQVNFVHFFFLASLDLHNLFTLSQVELFVDNEEAGCTLFKNHRCGVICELLAKLEGQVEELGAKF